MSYELSSTYVHDLPSNVDIISYIVMYHTHKSVANKAFTEYLGVKVLLIIKVVTPCCTIKISPLFSVWLS